MKCLITIIFILIAFLGLPPINNSLIFAQQINPELEIPSDIKNQIEKLHSQDPLIRGEAAKKLALMGEKAEIALPLLIELLADTSSIVWQKTIELFPHPLIKRLYKQ